MGGGGSTTLNAGCNKRMNEMYELSRGIGPKHGLTITRVYLLRQQRFVWSRCPRVVRPERRPGLDALERHVQRKGTNCGPGMLVTRFHASSSNSPGLSFVKTTFQKKQSRGLLDVRESSSNTGGLHPVLLSSEQTEKSNHQ